uniref:Uncharacterized protein n=1 Tax=Pyxicephalus adspersus TaxID=30357 RepID=A0AAV3AA81_PYXAD|nr:TPA: hypothetical protein GDO54_010531 [Pyxicephalus adspersus]
MVNRFCVILKTEQENLRSNLLISRTYTRHKHLMWRRIVIRLRGSEFQLFFIQNELIRNTVHNKFIKG